MIEKINIKLLAILSVMIKNFKVIFKSKKYYSILFLFPIIVMFIFGGLYFNTQSYKLSVGLVINEKTDLYRDYHSALEESGFSLIELYSTDICMDYIEKSIVNVCITFPKNFKIKDGEILQLNFIIDSTKKNLLPIIQNYLVEIINSQNNKVKEKVIVELIDNVQTGKSVTDSSKTKLLGAENSFEKVEEKLKVFDEGISSFKKQVLSGKKNVLFLIENRGDKKTSESLEEIEKVVELIKSNINGLETKIVNSNINESIKSSFKIKIDNSLNEIENLKTNLDEIDDLKVLDDKLKLILSNFENLEIEGKNLEGNLFKVKNGIAQIKADVVSVKNLQSKFNNKLNSISILNAKTVLSPVDFKVVSSNKEQTENHLNSMFPSLLIGFICLLSVFLASNFVYSEKRTQGYFRNILSRQKSYVFFIGNFLSLFFLVYFLSIFFVLFYQLYFLGSVSLGSDIFILIIPIICVFILVGMLIGSLVPNNLINFFASFFVILLFLLLSGKIFPLEVLSENLTYWLVYLNPFFLGEAILRRSYFFGTSISSMCNEIDLLILISFVLFGIMLFIESFIMRKEIYFFFVRLKLNIEKKSYKGLYLRNFKKSIIEKIKK
jgi:hypothetical protein